MEKTSAQLCTDTQISIWLRALLSLAWADGDFDQAEQSLVASITHCVTIAENAKALQSVTSEELATAFGQDPKMAENFLRTAVMVALADGSYSSKEDDLLHQFCQALQYPTEILETLRLTLTDCPTSPSESQSDPKSAISSSYPQGVAPHSDHLFAPLRGWLDNMEIHDPKVAHFLCKMIPPQCPFERDVKLFGHKIVHIPPLCKLNPLYEQLVGLRFRSLSYLADDCGEDVAEYC
ncbi:Mo-dependent nitrogenase C-terminal domain-containing protein [Phormidesmis priestleyi]